MKYDTKDCKVQLLTLYQLNTTISSFEKGFEQIHLPFSLLTVEGMPQLICLFSISIVIVDMNFGKQDHPYNKEMGNAWLETQINCPSQHLT